MDDGGYILVGGECVSQWWWVVMGYCGWWWMVVSGVG